MKKEWVRFLVSFALVITMGTFTREILLTSHQNQELKKDAAELNNFKYGLFSVNVWKRQLNQILIDEIDNFSLTKENERAIKSHLEAQLAILIDRMNERLMLSSSRLKQSLIQTFVDIDEIKKGIPDYARAIMKEMKRHRTEARIKSLMKEKLQEYIRKTFDADPKSHKKYIQWKYEGQDLQKLIHRTGEHINKQCLLLICSGILMFLLFSFGKKPLLPYHCIFITVGLILMLIVGVTTPMIDIEAKISSLNIVIMDHPIKFEEQVLYFQSKSILDVFNVMIHHKKLEMNLVGVLLVTFSIIFPLIKMLASLFYYYGTQKNRLINFFVLKAGKWSMADVLVVAIFMAYIGFNGILENQLGKLAGKSENLEIITTNGTSLRPGYFIFFAYAMLALFLSGMLSRRSLVAKTHTVRKYRRIWLKRKHKSVIKDLPYGIDTETGPIEPLQ